MRVCVTGGAGFIGHHLVGALIARGHEVVAVDNLRRGSFERPGLEHAICVDRDVRDSRDMAGAFRGCHAVVHLAAQSSVMGGQEDPAYSVDTNVSGTFSVAQAARDADVPHLIFASSREVYGESASLPVAEDAPLRPHNIYGATKVACEAILGALQWERPVVSVLRLANVVGAGDHGRVAPLWMDAARQGLPLTVFGGEQVLDFVPVETVVSAFVRLVEGGPVPGAVNVGSGLATPLRELATRILAAYPGAGELRIVPPRSVEVTRFQADVTRMRAVLGINPPEDPLRTLFEGDFA